MFLITRPNHDATMNYLFCWSEQLIQFAKNKGKKVIDLSGERANRKELEAIINKKNINFILFNGHGDYDSVKGQKNDILVKSSENANILANKIIYCRTCKSGKKLGIDCIISRAMAFIGYKEEFYFVYDQNNVARPLKDRYAKRFLESDNVCILSLLKGNTILDAFENSQYQYKKHIQEILTSSTDPIELTHSLPSLYWNLINHVYEGDRSACY